VLTSALLWGIILGSGVAISYTVRAWITGNYDPDWGRVIELYLYGYTLAVGIRLVIVAILLATTHESLEPWLLEEDKLYIGLVGLVLSLLSLDRIRLVFQYPSGAR
jgi:hypothetical protein